MTTTNVQFNFAHNDRHNQPLSPELIRQAKAQIYFTLSKMFGGATAIATEGAWIFEDGTLAIEPGTQISSFTDEITQEQINTLRGLASAVSTLLNQEATMFTYYQVVGKVEFVPAISVAA